MTTDGDLVVPLWRLDPALFLNTGSVPAGNATPASLPPRCVAEADYRIATYPSSPSSTSYLLTPSYLPTPLLPKLLVNSLSEGAVRRVNTVIRELIAEDVETSPKIVGPGSVVEMISCSYS